MLTIDDCIALSDLSEEEVAAIAEHDHIPPMLALELGHYLLEGPDGCLRIRRIILEDIETARSAGHYAHSARLKLVLRHFIETHPDASVRQRGRGRHLGTDRRDHHSDA